MTLAAFLDCYFIKQPKLRRFLTRSVYGSALVPISVLGADIVINSELENGYLRAFQKAKWLSLFRDEASVLINLAGLIDDDCTFVDAGANVGIYSAVISRLAATKRNLSVIAFEVDPDTFVRFRRMHGAMDFVRTMWGWPILRNQSNSSAERCHALPPPGN